VISQQTLIFRRVLTRKERRSVVRYLKRYYAVDQSLSGAVFVAVVLVSFALAIGALLLGAP
jgi:hypothetical protein